MKKKFENMSHQRVHIPINVNIDQNPIKELDKDVVPRIIINSNLFRSKKERKKWSAFPPIFEGEKINEIQAKRK